MVWSALFQVFDEKLPAAAVGAGTVSEVPGKSQDKGRFFGGKI